MKNINRSYWKLFQLSQLCVSNNRKVSVPLTAKQTRMVYLSFCTSDLLLYNHLFIQNMKQSNKKIGWPQIPFPSSPQKYGKNALKVIFWKSHKQQLKSMPKKAREIHISIHIFIQLSLPASKFPSGVQSENYLSFLKAFFVENSQLNISVTTPASHMNMYTSVYTKNIA